MNTLRLFCRSLLIVSILCPISVSVVLPSLHADEGESLVTGNGIQGTNLNQSPKTDWNSMSDSEKQEMRERWKRFKAMNANERSELKSKFEKFKAMNPEKRQQMVKTFNHFKSFPESRQMAIRKRFEQFKSLSPDEKKKRIQALREHRRATGKGPMGSGANNPNGNQMGGPNQGGQNGGQPPGSQSPGGPGPGMKRNQFNKPGMKTPFQDGQHRPRPKNQRNRGA